jgi:hypothetical protein
MQDVPPGWHAIPTEYGMAVFTRQQYERAEIPNGTRVRKINTKPGDVYVDGWEGVVIGSAGHESLDPEVGYFVIWDGSEIPIGTIGSKLEMV